MCRMRYVKHSLPTTPKAVSGNVSCIVTVCSEQNAVTVPDETVQDEFTVLLTPPQTDGNRRMLKYGLMWLADCGLESLNTGV